MRKHDLYTMSGSTTTNTTAAHVVGSVVRGLAQYDRVAVSASVAGVPLGTLDVYLQRQVARADQVTGGVWEDWLHLPQLAEGASRVYYASQSEASTSARAVGRGTDASAGTPALAANTAVGGHPGDALRLVAKCGSATLTGTSLSLQVTGWRRYL